MTSSLEREATLVAAPEVSGGGPAPRVAAIVRRIARPEAFQLLGSMVAVQGLTYAAQFALARMLGPADFGVVRSVESALGFLLIAATFGMPSLLLRDVAAARDAARRRFVVQRLAAIAACIGFVVAASAALASSLLVAAPATRYLRVLALTLAVTATSRTLLNYFQAIGRVGTLSAAASVGAAVSMTAIVVGARLFGLMGWASGRVAGELLLLGLVAMLTRRALSGAGRDATGPSVASYVREGATVAAALVLRSVLDAFPVLAAGRLTLPLVQVGWVGLATLATLPLLLVPGIAATLWIPELAAAADRPHAAAASARQMGAAFVAYAVPALVAAWLVVPVVIARVLPAYAGAIPLVQLLLLAVPARVLAYIPGALCLALRLNHIPLIANAITLGTVVTASVWFGPGGGVLGLLRVVVVSEVLGAIVLGALAAVALRARGVRRPHAAPAGVG